VIEYESALIAACVRDEESFMKAQDMNLKEDAFTQPQSQQVWAALSANFHEGIPHSKVELTMRLVEMFPGDAQALDTWMTSVSGEVKDITPASKWLDHVAQSWQDRRKSAALEEVVALSAGGAEPSEIAEHLSSKLAEIEDSTTLEDQRMQRQRDAVIEHNRLRILGKAGLIELGIPFIDHQCGKIRSHEYIVVGARPSVGKSALAREIMMGPVKTNNQPVMMFSLERPVDEVIIHLASTNCGVSVRNVEDDFEPNQQKLIEEQERFANALGKYLFIHENIVEIRDIEHQIGLAMRRHRPALVIIDYLQLVQASHLKVSREQQVAHISRRLKLMANQYRVPIIVLAQLNRGNVQEDREPELYDLRESGSLEQDADAVWFLHRPKDAKMINGVQERKFIQAKRRGGTVESFDIGFVGRITKFDFNPVEEQTFTDRKLI